jgi:VWFA-related protein
MKTLMGDTRRFRFRLGWWPLTALLLVPAVLRAQDQPAAPPPPAAAPQETGVVIKRETKLVLVDAVVTDKKGNYIRDLTATDFKVFEDNKEQPISNFSSGSDASNLPANAQQRRYLILFFDNSTMAAPDQIQARSAAQKFIDANAGPDHLMAVVDFGGSLRIRQNFTANADILRAAVSGVKSSSVDPNAPPPNVGVTVASAGAPSIGMSSLSSAEADFGARSMLLAVRSLAKNLRSIPGRKMVVLFSGGFPPTSETQSELSATIAACNQANVAIYALDARGLVSGGPSASGPGMAQQRTGQPSMHAAAHRPHVWSWQASRWPCLIRSVPAAAVVAAVAVAAGVLAVVAVPRAVVPVAAVAAAALVVAPAVARAAVAAAAQVAVPAEVRAEQAAPLAAAVAASELPSIPTTIRTHSRAPSCRNFLLLLPPISRFLRSWPKAPAASLSSIPMTCLAVCKKSAASRASSMYSATLLRTQRREVATF